MKYVINGGIGTAITLFGMSYLYGITGSTNIVDMQKYLRRELGWGHSVIVSSPHFYFYSLDSHFKIATVPFHMWAPDVYEGAATPVTAFLGTISKISSVFSTSLYVCFLWCFRCGNPVRRRSIFIRAYEYIYCGTS